MAERQAKARKKHQVDTDRHQETREGDWFVPPADIYETEDAMTILLDMPGVSNENVNVNVQAGEMVISGYYGSDVTPGEERIHTEYEAGHYHRHFSLSQDFGVDQIEAKMKDGVLTVVLPKPEVRKPRRIEVRPG